MKNINSKTYSKIAAFSVAFAWMTAAQHAAAAVSQTPLLLGGGNVPGNLVLVPSVEYPTVISEANIGDYIHAKDYLGNFDYKKCYTYIETTIDTHPRFGKIEAKDGGGYFSPTKKSRDCTGEWSGNYLNWATTQTIDPFRIALTGGYRVVDTNNQTIIEKATRAGRTESFDDKSAGVVKNSTSNTISPFENSKLTSSVKSGNTDYKKNKTVLIKREYKDTNDNTITNSKHYSVRVEVCKADLLEDNCVKYGSTYKPEGLIQQYEKNIRYSVFSYLNVNGTAQNGGVLRAAQKYVGDKMRIPGNSSEVDNAYAEWDVATGILKTNPHNDSTGNSGVINYINKFGELTNQHKSNDPVSELYYAATRYLRGMNNLADYTKNSSTNTQKDNFPVITDWVDPIQYACQKNVILGIGDVNTHEDRNLPPGDDTSLKVNSYTQKIFDLENVGKSASASSFSGRGNSAYIAGLAYYANTTDLRPDIAGKQTASTHWVDVRENRVLQPKNNNQYWLAAQYGGFKVPKDFGDPLERATSLPDSLWYTNSETLETKDKRPDNFYVASDAQKMVDSLKQAFAQIVSDVRSTTTSISANSFALATDTTIYVPFVDSTRWSGDLVARRINPDKTIDTTPLWSAAQKLDITSPSTRNILTITPGTETSTGTLSSSGQDFNWASLSSTQKEALRKTLGSTALVDEAVGENRLDYLRGTRDLERSITKPDAAFRQRDSRLGDIVNSEPQFIHRQSFSYGSLPVSLFNTAAAKYITFRQQTSYTNRPPMLLVGANDGMLHGFDASSGTNGGKEIFAYVPNGVMDNLYELTLPNYGHRYYVDGAPRISDIWDGSKWRTITVGATGAGGKSVFALDITSPTSMTKSNVLWEFTHPQMGYTLGRPSIAALPNGEFGVVITSGYERGNEPNSHVWILNATTGALIKHIEIEDTGDLGSSLTVDINADRVADRIYVGDTKGNLWRINLDDESPNAWEVQGSPVFIAKTGSVYQAITAPLNAALDPQGDVIVTFGTGSFYRTTDNEVSQTPTVETFYAVIDRDANTTTLNRSDLRAQTIDSEISDTNYTARTVSNNDLGDKSGWYLDLKVNGAQAKGERVTTQALLRGDGAVRFTTLTPSADPCTGGATYVSMALSFATGKRLPYNYFDYNKDGIVDDNDFMTVGDQKYPASGISSNDTDSKTQVSPGPFLCQEDGSIYDVGLGTVVAGTCPTAKRTSWQEVRSE